MSADPFSDPRAFRWVESGVSGLAPPREWDAVALAECAAAGDRCVVVRASAERQIVEEGDPAAAACATRTLEGDIEPPYRAVALRRAGHTWAVGAVAIEVAELSEELEGEDAVLVVGEDGERQLTVDGRPTLVDMDVFEDVAGGRFDAYVLRARRLAADLWEVAVHPL